MVSSSRSWLVSLSVISLAFIAISSYCYGISHARILWSDELFGWMLVSDATWRHMLYAWELGADGGGLAFYVLCRLWLGIFGHSALAFRAFSAANIFLAFVAMWFTLRRYYQPAFVAVGLFLVWFGSRTILWQMFQTRFYGLLLAACAAVVWAQLRSAREADAGAVGRRGTMLLVFFFNLLLVGTHPLGIFYSALVLLAAVMDDLLSRRRRPVFYLAALSSWTLLLPSHTAMRNSAAVGKPWFWTVTPNGKDLVDYLTPYWLPHVHKLAFILSVCFAIALCRSQFRARIAGGAVQRRSLLLIGICLASAPFLVWLVSHHGTSYFVDRYLIPFTIGMGILWIELVTLLLPQPFQLRKPIPLVVSMATLLILGSYIARDSLHDFPQIMQLPPHDFTGSLATMLPAGEPVLFERVDVFDLMTFYRAGPRLFPVFVIDKPMAMTSQAPRGLISGENEMENWRRVGYFPEHIQLSDTFLANTHAFAVVSSPEIPWLEQRLQSQPGWHVTRLGEFHHGFWSETVWQVVKQ